MPKKVAKQKKASSSKDSKKVESTKPPPDPSDHFVRRFQLWANSNLKRIQHFCSNLRTSSDSQVTFTVVQFTGCLFDLQAPFSREELQQVLTFFAARDGGGQINLQNFQEAVQTGQLLMLYSSSDGGGGKITTDAEGMSEISENSKELTPSELSANAVASSIPSTKSVSYRCPDCAILKTELPVEINPKIVRVHLVLSTFHKTESHPAHFVTTVLASQTVHGLRMAVREHLGGSVQSVALFCRLPCEERNFMKPHHELERYLNLGDGGGGCVPGVAVLKLYYDYTAESGDDSILMAENGLFKVKSSTVPVHRF